MRWWANLYNNSDIDLINDDSISVNGVKTSMISIAKRGVRANRDLPVCNLYEFTMDWLDIVQDFSVGKNWSVKGEVFSKKYYSNGEIAGEIANYITDTIYISDAQYFEAENLYISIVKKCRKDLWSVVVDTKIIDSCKDYLVKYLVSMVFRGIKNDCLHISKDDVMNLVGAEWDADMGYSIQNIYSWEDKIIPHSSGVLLNFLKEEGVTLKEIEKLVFVGLWEKISKKQVSSKKSVELKIESNKIISNINRRSIEGCKLNNESVGDIFTWINKYSLDIDRDFLGASKKGHDIVYQNTINNILNTINCKYKKEGKKISNFVYSEVIRMILRAPGDDLFYFFYNPFVVRVLKSRVADKKVVRRVQASSNSKCAVLSLSMMRMPDKKKETIRGIYSFVLASKNRDMSNMKFSMIKKSYTIRREFGVSFIGSGEYTNPVIARNIESRYNYICKCFDDVSAKMEINSGVAGVTILGIDYRRKTS